MSSNIFSLYKKASSVEEFQNLLEVLTTHDLLNDTLSHYLEVNFYSKSEYWCYICLFLQSPDNEWKVSSTFIINGLVQIVVCSI